MEQLTVKELGQRAKAVSSVLASASPKQKNDALAAIADALIARTDEIIEANKTDLENAASPTEDVQEIAVGAVGTAKTFLRPVGQASFTMPDGSTRLFDVQTHGEIIEAGTRVQVTAVQEGHIWVSPENQ